MGIDAKETSAILWKILGSSMTASTKFMKNHPIFSGISICVLLLYIFLPSLLFFLIYSSPVLVCALLYAREKLGLRFPSSHLSFSSSVPKSCGGGNGGVRCHLRQQRSVRRNARMKVEEWDSQTSEEEKDKVILTPLYNDLLGRTPHFEESPKAFEDNEKAFRGEDSCDSGNLNVENPMVCKGEINEEKNRGLDGNEEAREEMSNVIEHGLSEIERNRRLEDLIARRRARRLFKLALSQRNKLQAEESNSLAQNNNLQITVRKDNTNTSPEKLRNYPSESTVEIPGSAPSVLLQGRNPFDIPYDPLEERPNLTGDSFDEEFSLFNPKDMFFCRHESFSRFARFSSEHAPCINSPVPASDISTGLDNEYMDHTQQKLPCNGKEAAIEEDDKSVESEKSGERDVEMNDETDSEKEGDDSSCSEESESELNRLNEAELKEAIRHTMDINQTRNNIPSTLPRGLVAPRLDDNNMFYTRRCGNLHGRTFSVASDMQVEFSEIGSPPTTVDWLDEWSNGGESCVYDTDIEREIVRNEEARKRVSHQYESRNGTGLKEENYGPETKLVAEPGQKCMADEQLRMVDDTPFSETRSQTEEIFEQNPSSSSDVSKPTSSGKFEGLLFHPSASLSSITEEPETILDSIDGGNSEKKNSLPEELTDHRSLTSLDLTRKKLSDEEVADVQQTENDDICGSPKIIYSNVTDHQQKDQVLNNNRGEHDTEINMNKYDNTDPSEYEANQSFLYASLDTSNIESSEREMEEKESKLGNFTEDITKQSDNDALRSDLKSSPEHVPTELLESEVTGANGWELVKNTDEKTKPVEQEKAHNFLKSSSSHPHTQLLDNGNAENASNVVLVQVQDDNNSTLYKSTDQEISKEGENTGLLKDLNAESTQEHNNVAKQEESIVPADTQNSQGSQTSIQQSDINSLEGISPRTLEITQKPADEDGIASNTVSQNIVKGEFAAASKKDSAACENNDEENLKRDEQVGEAMEKQLELNSESVNNNNGGVSKKEDEESKNIIGAVNIAEIETTKD